MGNVLTRDLTRREQRLNKRLNKLHEDIYLSSHKWKEEHYDEREAVIETVHAIAREIGIADSRLKVQNVILVGSVAEDTQLRGTSDYDFQLVLEDFSQLNSVNVSKACAGRDCYVHIEIKDSDLRLKWKSMIVDDLLKSTKGRKLGLRKAGLRQLFHETLTKALREIKVIHKQTGSLYCQSDVVKHGPAYTINLEWNPGNKTGVYRPLSVDICPVIRLCGPLSEIIGKNDVQCQKYYKYAEENGLVMLMPYNRKTSCRTGLCFKMTFTTTEVLLMMDMSEHHRKCYRILKYLLNGNNMYLPTAFCSYQLKVQVLNHHYDQNCSEESDLAKCIHNIVDNMIAICKTRCKGQLFGPNPFVTTQNLWDHETSLRDKDLEDRLVMLQSGLKQISKECSCCIDIDPVNSSNFLLSLCDKVGFSIIFLLVLLLVFMCLVKYNESFINIREPESNRNTSF